MECVFRTKMGISAAVSFLEQVQKRRCGRGRPGRGGGGPSPSIVGAQRVNGMAERSGFLRPWGKCPEPAPGLIRGTKGPHRFSTPTKRGSAPPVLSQSVRGRRRGRFETCPSAGVVTPPSPHEGDAGRSSPLRPAKGDAGAKQPQGDAHAARHPRESHRLSRQNALPKEAHGVRPFRTTKGARTSEAT